MRTRNLLLRKLGLEILLGLEPAFKAMPQITGQIKNDHADAAVFFRMVPGTGIEPVQP